MNKINDIASSHIKFDMKNKEGSTFYKQYSLISLSTAI